MIDQDTHSSPSSMLLKCSCGMEKSPERLVLVLSRRTRRMDVQAPLADAARDASSMYICINVHLYICKFAKA